MREKADMDNAAPGGAVGGTTYPLVLTPAQLKVTHAALRTMLDGGRHDPDVRRVLYAVLGKLPDDRTIREINFGGELRRERRDERPR